MSNTINLSSLERERLLRQAADAYYNGQPRMTDAEFDEVWQSHKNDRALNPDDPLWTDTILDRVGAPVLSGKIKHISKMMSLDNAFLQEGEHQLSEVYAWLARLDLGNMAEFVEFVTEPKIDGFSASVIYEDGLLTRVVTRGDGEVGEDITENVIAADLVPQSIIPDAPWNGAGTSDDPRGIKEVRGEIFMSFGAFEVLCEKARMTGEDPPSNPRNAASGIIRRKDTASLYGCGLQFMAHGVENPTGDSYRGEIGKLKALGFNTTEHVGFFGDKVPELDVLRKLLAQPYPTDGVVFKMDSFKLRKALGSTSRAPKWAIALKFEQEQVTTKCNAITIQVGRSGILTPVAELEPIEVDGSVVSRATLHNEDQVNRLGLLPGDRVVLQKAGGIIPEIVSVVVTLKAGRAVGKCWEGRKPWSLLKHIGHACPACGSEDILVTGTIENSMVEAELVRKLGLGTPTGATTQTNLGEVRRQMRATMADLPKVTVERLRDDNAPGLSLDKFKEEWLSDVVVNITGSGLRYSCGNLVGCKAQMAARVEHMAGRGCLNIMGLGTEACDAIAQRGIDHPFDILDKDVEWFASLSWVTESGKNMTFGKSRATKVVAACADAKKAPLNRWITALGIHSIGVNTGKEISRLFSNARQLIALRKRFREDIAVDAICRIAAGEDKKSDMLLLTNCSNHLGPVSCNELINFVDSDWGLALLNRIDSYGVKSDNHNPIPMKDTTEATGALAGKSFCVTGTLSESRDNIHSLIIANGGTVVSSVTKKTNVLVAGDKAGSKMKKAADLGVEVWSESDLRGLLP